MVHVLPDFAGNFIVVLHQNHLFFRLAVRLIDCNALVLEVTHGTVDNHLRSAARCIWERHCVLDLILLMLDAGENEDGDNVRILLGNPVATMLKVEPRLERRLERGK